jgi:uncharacterized protein YaeQ
VTAPLTNEWFEIMALPSIRYEFRMTLSHVDRGIDLTETVVAARHPSETAEHLVLRVLSWCLLHREGIGFGAGLSDPDAADLEARDGVGRVSLWVECGAVDGEKLRRVLAHNSDAEVHVVFGAERRREELLAQLAAAKRVLKGAERLALWTIDAALVAALAALEQRRQRWVVTIVGDHFYVEADGVSHDGAALRQSVG